MNHCGPDIFLNKIIPQSLLGVDISSACRQHDKDYQEGNLDRKESDKIFFKNMLFEIDRQNARFPVRGIQKLGALFYYLFVRLFGGFFYQKSRGLSVGENTT